MTTANPPIRLPEIFEQRLKGTDHYAAVQTAITDLGKIYKGSKAPFFADYTDHQADHIQGVLDAAANLMGEEVLCMDTPSNSCLKPEDFAALAMAVILHDAALHIHEDAFVWLVQQTKVLIPAIDKEDSWNKLYSDYVFEAKHFDARTHFDVFGTSDVIPAPNLDEPGKWTDEQKKYIGEFIRRHHARLAHEIAIAGFLGPEGPVLTFDQFAKPFLYLVGLIARSHGMGLREAIEHLEEPQRQAAIHVTYLMAILRIADYLEFAAPRASGTVLQIKNIRSPLSARHWKTNLSIVDGRPHPKDPEAIKVEFDPSRLDKVGEYLLAEDTLKDLQAELDKTWAVLGEVYGRSDTTEFAYHGLRLRRITSNLDSPAFKEALPYHPVRAEFHTATPQLLKLLVKPLYGDRPEIGIRELQQNAVDACRELWDYFTPDDRPDEEKRAIAREKLGLTEDQADIEMRLEEDEEGNTWFTIQDQGIGMTVDTILNYYLRVGASYRDSSDWQEQHENPDANPRIVRTGRFGIGALATSLLGDDVYLETRYVSEKEGVRFFVTRSREPIWMERREVVLSSGTRIRIRLSSDVTEWFSDQTSASPSELDTSQEHLYRSVFAYRFQYPTIDFYSKVSGASNHRRIRWRKFLPYGEDKGNDGWHQISTSGYEDVHWSYLHGDTWLHVNGFGVEEENEDRPRGNSYDKWIWQETQSTPLIYPKLSVVDKSGKLELDLKREYIEEWPLSCDEKIFVDVLRDLLAHCLVMGPLRMEIDMSTPFRYRSESSYPGWPSFALMNTGFTGFWLKSKSGFLFCDPRLTQSIACIDKIVLLTPDDMWRSSYSASSFLGDFDTLGLFQPDRNVLQNDFTRRCLKIFEKGGIGHFGPFKDVLYISGEIDRLDPRIAKPKFLRSLQELGLVFRLGDRVMIGNEHSKMFENDLEHRLKAWDIPSERTEMLCIFPSSQDSIEETMLSELWLDYIGPRLIPYDMEERRDVLGDAFERLAPYVKAWEEIAAREKRGASS